MVLEIEFPIEAYKDYLIKSYNLIEESKAAFQRDYEILKGDNELEKEMINWSNYEVNEQIIISWHSSTLISIISLLEKSMQYILYIKFETRYRENHAIASEYTLTEDENKIIQTEIKEKIEAIKKGTKGSPLIAILYKEIIYVDNTLIEKGEIKTIVEELIELNRLRNCYIHQYGYFDEEKNKSILFQKASKENLLEICNKVYTFLSYLYNTKNALDGLEGSTSEEIEHYFNTDQYELDERGNII